MVTLSGSPAIKVLEDEIASVENAQDPTRNQIAELEAQLIEGQQIIARNRAAIALLTGRTPLPTAPSRRSSSRSPGTPPEARAAAILTFVKAQSGGTTAKAIAEDLEISTNTLNQTLAPMLAAGALRSEGERRGRKIFAA